MKGLIELEVELTGSILPGRPATMYNKNGDPGDPAEGGELIDFQVWFHGIDITGFLSDSDREYLEQDFINRSCDGDRCPEDV